MAAFPPPWRSAASGHFRKAHIARRAAPLQSNAQIDSCGRCHSRRGTLGDYHYGADLLDTHRLSLPQWPLYYPDGQIRDEDYVYGSFVQSKMHQAGVVCSNCHEPHSLHCAPPATASAPSATNRPSTTTAQHHHHPEGSTGAQCANCHMPETTYMGVDPRRDHSMRIPRPDLSVVMGTPNACNQCHQDKDAPGHWMPCASGACNSGTPAVTLRALSNGSEGDNRAVPALAQLAKRYRRGTHLARHCDGSTGTGWRARRPANGHPVIV